jgi:hypothetical protein
MAGKGKSDSVASWPDFLVQTLSWLKRNPWLIVGFFAFSVLLYLGIRVARGSDPLTRLFPTIFHPVQFSAQSSTNAYSWPDQWESLHRGEAARLKELEVALGDSQVSNPYIVSDLLYFVRLEDEVKGSMTQRVATVRCFYRISALKTITSNKSVFPEGFESTTGSVSYDHGTESERSEELHSGGSFVIDPTEYALHLDLLVGDSKLFYTGTTITSPLPLAQRTDHGIPLDANHDIYCYYNRDDAISRATIVVESRSLGLKEAWHLHRPPEYSYFPKGKDGSETAVLVGRWKNVVPGKRLIVPLRW